MRYQGNFVHTRKGALIYAAILSGLLMVLVAMRADDLERTGIVMLGIMTTLPLSGAYRSCRFLAKMEQRNDAPTPEMTFILGSAVTTATVMFAFVMITISHYR